MGSASFFLLSQLSPVNDRIPAALKNLDISHGFLPLQQKRKKVVKKSPRWACGCANMTEKEQFRKGCTKGFAFESMTSASQFAQAQCGETCIPDCHVINLDPDSNEDSIDL